MLEMDEGRVSFADVLRPPEGYELSFAVATTYSLDLRALLGICIPLGLGFEPEALDSVNPVSLFAALKRMQGKLAVYCDKGSMRADVAAGSQTSGLLMLLEGMVHQVHVNWRRKDALSSFHPKVWVVEYSARNGGAPLYRLIVMSRNLTFDTSWDVVVALDGHPGEGNACSEHVAQFLEFLAAGDSETTTEYDDTRRRSSHTARIRRLADAIRKVRFKVDDRNFDSVDFLPFGPQGGRQASLMDARKCSLLTSHWRSLLVVSPFLSGGDDSPLIMMAHNRSGSSGRFVLLSREDSLVELPDNVRGAYECFCPASSLADVELDGEGGVNAANYSSLHAKLYFTQDAGSRRKLWTGSLNASRNGTFNNVEALIVLNVRSGYLTFQQVLKPLIGEGSNERPPFVPFDPPELVEAVAEGDEEFRRAFRIASRLVSFRAVKVSGNEDEAWMDVTLEVASTVKACAGVALTLKPLLASNSLRIELGARISRQELSFTGLQPEQVSAFFVIEGTDGGGNVRSCVTICPHDRFDDAGLSLEARSSEVLGAILSQNSQGISQYLAHAFDLPEAAYAINGESQKSASSATGKSLSVPVGFYERLLDMADTNPEVFARATELLELIPEDVRNDQLDDLRDLVETFSKAVK